MSKCQINLIVCPQERDAMARCRVMSIALSPNCTIQLGIFLAWNVINNVIKKLAKICVIITQYKISIQFLLKLFCSLNTPRLTRPFVMDLYCLQKSMFHEQILLWMLAWDIQIENKYFTSWRRQVFQNHNILSLIYFYGYLSHSASKFTARRHSQFSSYMSRHI